MIRRRRPQRRIEFSFDSFLDVVANVVGIILRLILVAWVGARSYKGPPPPVAEQAASSRPAEDTARQAGRHAADTAGQLVVSAEWSGLRRLDQAGTAAAPSPEPLLQLPEAERQELARAQAELLARLKEFNDLRVQEPTLNADLVQATSRA